MKAWSSEAASSTPQEPESDDEDTSCRARNRAAFLLSVVLDLDVQPEHRQHRHRRPFPTESHLQLERPLRSGPKGPIGVPADVVEDEVHSGCMIWCGEAWLAPLPIDISYPFRRAARGPFAFQSRIRIERHGGGVALSTPTTTMVQPFTGVPHVHDPALDDHGSTSSWRVHHGGPTSTRCSRTSGRDEHARRRPRRRVRLAS